MFEIERIFGIDPVVTVVVNHTDNEASGQLTRKQIFLTKVEVAAWDGERFADHSTNGVLGITNLQRLCMGDED